MNVSIQFARVIKFKIPLDKHEFLSYNTTTAEEEISLHPLTGHMVIISFFEPDHISV